MDRTRRLLVVSAPTQDQRWDAALVPAGEYRGLQALLGWDAQLKSFVAGAGKYDLRCFAAPAPELFFTRQVLESLAPRIRVGIDDLERGVHVRFGPARHARLLRGMENYLAPAETQAGRILAPGAHPFRHHDVAPHAMRTALDLSGQGKKLLRPDGTEITRRAAPPDLAAADLPNFAGRDVPLNAADFNGFEVASLSEFNPEEWSAGKSIGPSMQLRRMILEAGGGQLRPVIMVPWNLANPASCVPDLAVKFAGMMFRQERPPYLVLLPFNAARAVATQLWPQIEAIAPAIAEVTAGAVGCVLVARVTDLAAISLLRRMNAMFWIDGLDPEAIWTKTRLDACGLSSQIMTAQDEDTTRHHVAVLAEAPMLEQRDEFGQRFFERRVITLRGLRRMLEMPHYDVPQENAAANDMRGFFAEL